jgi:hypothetical protein
MGDKRQKIQQLAFTAARKGEAPTRDGKGTESSLARYESESPNAEPPCADPHARWCGRGVAARLPPIPIAAACRRFLVG